MATRKVAEHQLAENGDIIQFRDIDLASADKQTTVGTTDSVILEGEDGVFHKIKKASFNEAVRDALGALVSNLDKGAASTNKVLATDANNDLGTMTPANLASVLSAWLLVTDTKRFLTWVDHETPSGTFLCNYGRATSGVPNDHQAILTVDTVTYNNNFFKSFKYHEVANNKIFVAILSSSTVGQGFNWREI